MESLVSQSDESRKREGPSGKNCTPFTKEERKAINAEDERQRSNQAVEAMLELTDAAGLPNNHDHGKRMKLNEVTQVVSEPQTIIPESPPVETPNTDITNQPIPNSLSTEQYSSDHNILCSGDLSSSFSRLARASPLAHFTSSYHSELLRQMARSVEDDIQKYHWDAMLEEEVDY